MHLEQNAVYKIQEQNGVCQIDALNTVSKIVVDYGVFFFNFSTTLLSVCTHCNTQRIHECVRFEI